MNNLSHHLNVSVASLRLYSLRRNGPFTSSEYAFLFKLALNPFTGNNQLMQTATSPAPGQDFEQIALWYAEKRDAYSFCEDLWEEVLRDKGFPKLSPHAVLGRSYFESLPQDLKDAGSAYGPGSRWARRFQALADKDPTFRQYLDTHNIAPGNLDLKQGPERAAEVRKVAPIVAVREFYRKTGGQSHTAERQMRSRKTAALYAGADSVFAITEGNPRWFIGLFGRLLTELAPGRAKISPPTQGRELLDAAQRFTATLRTIPVVRSAGPAAISVMQLIRLAGRYFHNEAVRGPFRPEPPGSFTVDSKSPDSLIDALSQALNAGAIVYVPDDEGQLILTSLRGKRFRLSYLLAPIYGFPIRLGKDVALNTIIGSQQKRTDSREPQRSDFMSDGNE